MELWDTEAIDLLGPAFVEFADGQQGSFRFIAVEGWMDVRPTEVHGSGAVEFSWEGQDECDPETGRGWAPGENWLLPGGDEARAEQLLDKCTIELHAGDVLRMLTPGGGGWGQAIT
jgi:hypothetical protein